MPLFHTTSERRKIDKKDQHRRLHEAAERRARPEFSHEGPDLYGAAYQQNAPYAQDPGQQTLLPLEDTQGPYETTLSPLMEAIFRHMGQQPAKDGQNFFQYFGFNPNRATNDYDMRGLFSQGEMEPSPEGHFPDTFKTPYDTTFSDQSAYSTPDNPNHWEGEDLINRKTGRLVFR